MLLKELNQRSLEIFKYIVETYMETGSPVGSKTLCDRVDLGVSSATVRNVMYTLEQMGLLFSPHTSAGRLPTEAGLRFFVNGLMEVHALTPQEQITIQEQCSLSGLSGKNIKRILDDTVLTLSDLSKCAGFVAAPRIEAKLHHIEFVPLNPKRLLVIMVTDDGHVENRLLEIDVPLPRSVLNDVSDYLNTLVEGKTIKEALALVRKSIQSNRLELDELAQRLVEAGLGCWTASEEGEDSFILLHGQSNLLEDVTLEADLERLRHLFSALETKKNLLDLLSASADAQGVQIFIGADNHLFRHQGCSMVIAPYHGKDRQMIGAIGVIGPTRINYSKIIPMVDYTAHLVSSLLSQRE